MYRLASQQKMSQTWRPAKANYSASGWLLISGAFRTFFFWARISKPLAGPHRPPLPASSTEVQLPYTCERGCLSARDTSPKSFALGRFAVILEQRALLSEGSEFSGEELDAIGQFKSCRHKSRRALTLRPAAYYAHTFMHAYRWNSAGM